MGAIVGIVLGFLLFFIWLFKGDLDRNKKLKKKIQEDWEKEEELLFDEYTGKMVTVEEARLGIEVNEEDLNRVKSDEEILDYFYEGWPREVELAKNELRKSGIKLTTQELDLEKILFDSSVISGAVQIQSDEIFEVNACTHVCFITLDFYDQRYSTKNILLLVETKQDLGHYLMFYVNEATKWLTEKTEKDVITSIEHFIVDPIKPVAQQDRMIEFLRQLAPTGHLTVETCNNYIFVFTNDDATQLELTSIMELYSRIIESKFVQLKTVSG